MQISSTHRFPLSKPSYHRLKLCGVFVFRIFKAWQIKREKRRTIMMMAELPDEILHDIGWPMAGPFDNVFAGSKKSGTERPGMIGSLLP